MVGGIVFHKHNFKFVVLFFLLRGERIQIPLSGGGQSSASQRNFAGKPMMAQH